MSYTIPMTLNVRRIYFVLIIILFGICAPLLTLYAAGWRYDFSKARIIRVGSIVVESEPDKAAILLNNKLQPKKTPATFNSVFPGDYTLSLTKDGYRPWQRQLAVVPSKTIFAQASLVKDSDITQLTDSTHYSISPHGTYYALAESDGQSITLLLRATTDRTAATSLTLASLPSHLAWSAQEQYVMIVHGHDISLWDSSNDNVTERLADYFGMPFSFIQWSDAETDVFYGLVQSNLYRFNIRQKTATRLPFTGTLAGHRSDNFFVHEQNALYVYTSQGELQASLDVLPSARITVLAQQDESIPILDTVHQRLYFYDTRANIFTRYPDPVTGYVYDEKTNIALLYNQYEIWTEDDRGGQRLIVRTSDHITDAALLLEGVYILYTTGKGQLLLRERLPQTQNIYQISKTGSAGIRAVAPEIRRAYIELRNGLGLVDY